jgi:hypothetical protein
MYTLFSTWLGVSFISKISLLYCILERDGDFRLWLDIHGLIPPTFSEFLNANMHVLMVYLLSYVDILKMTRCLASVHSKTHGHWSTSSYGTEKKCFSFLRFVCSFTSYDVTYLTYQQVV